MTTTADQLADIEARLKADQAEYAAAGQYDQSIRDRAALLALVRKQSVPLDLHDLLPEVTQSIRDLTIYASPPHLARVALEAAARAGFGDVRQVQARLAAVQELVAEVLTAEAEYGRTAAVSGCVSVHRLQTALAGEGN